MSLSLTSRLTQKALVKGLIVAILTAFAAIVVLPHYWTGQWPWLNPPSVAQIKTLREIKASGITLPDWQTAYQEEVSFGGNQWSIQEFTSKQPIEGAPSNGQGAFLLLLRSQGRPQDQPEVEWLDLKGAQQWSMDSQRQLRLLSSSPEPEIARFDAQTNFLRVWNQQQTYAALQWYAWPGGGHPSPSHWFWGDQKAQWQQRQRLPWVAVSLLVPIEPLGDIMAYQGYVEHLGQVVQQALQTDIFKSSSPM